MRHLSLETNDGEHAVLPYEMVYGCAMRRMETDGIPGIQCESFLVGGLKDLKLHELEDPISTSIARVLEQMVKEEGDLVAEALGASLIRRIGVRLVDYASKMEVEQWRQKMK